MLENQVIEYIRQRALRASQTGIRLGIGDDTAILKPVRSDQESLLTTDQVIENTHFLREQHPPEALGWKCLARGLSDIAAMGGEPGHFLLSLGLPAWALENAWLKQFLSGMFQLSTFARTTLIGGDVARAERFTAHVAVTGSVPVGLALRRDKARAGDTVYVSGELGGSALGFERLGFERLGSNSVGCNSSGAGDPAVERHLRPQPRLDLGRYLRKTARATTAIDLSDGLSTDVRRVAQASGVGIEIDESAVPRFGDASTKQALHGGEEYELLFTARSLTAIPKKRNGLRLTPIGRVVARRGVYVISSGKRRPLKPEGFEHF